MRFCAGEHIRARATPMKKTFKNVTEHIESILNDDYDDITTDKISNYSIHLVRSNTARCKTTAVYENHYWIFSRRINLKFLSSRIIIIPIVVYETFNVTYVGRENVHVEAVFVFLLSGSVW